MHDRFDRVDQALNKIYETLNDRFDKIDLQLGRLNANVEEIQRSLFGLQADIDRLEKNLYSFLNAGFRRDLKEAINGAIDYRQRTGVQMSYAPEYVNYENKFYTWATSNASDELQAGANNRSFTDDKLLAELSGQPLESNINYLAQLVPLRFVGVPTFANTRLANPRDWAVSGEAYVRMAAENPRHFKRIDRNRARIDNIHKIGTALQTALKNITVVNTPEGPKANYALFDALINYYKTKAAGVKPRIKQIEDDHLIAIGQDDYRKGFTRTLNLWGRANQPTGFVPQVTSISPCAGANTNGVSASLAVPTDFVRLIPNPYLLADELGLGKIELCYTSVDWVDRQTNRKDVPLYPGCMWTEEHSSGVLSITVRASFLRKTVFLRSLKSTQRVLFY